jgi:hypothetical protein
MHFNVIHLCLGLPSVLFGFPRKPYMHIFPTHLMHILPISSSSSYSHYIRRRVKIIKLLNKQISATSYHFIPTVYNRPST